VSTTEPIVALTLRFESEMDLALAAAEAGLRLEEFEEQLARSRLLARTLGSLNVEGGTVQRQVFIAAFGDIVREMRLGLYVHPAIRKEIKVEAPIGKWEEVRQVKVGNDTEYRRKTREFRSDGTLIITYMGTGDEATGTWRREGKKIYTNFASPDMPKWFSIIEVTETSLTIVMEGQRRSVWKRLPEQPAK
jgi:hypothetical protein